MRPKTLPSTTLGRRWSTRARTVWVLVTVISTLMLATLFNPLRHRLQALLDRRFYRTKVDFHQALITFSREVRTIIDLPELLRVLVARISDLLHITHSAIFLHQADGTFRLAEARNLPPDVAAHLPLDETFCNRLQNGEIIAQPQDPTFPLLVPLIAWRASGRDLVGVLALGPRRSGQGYSRADQAQLMGLVEQAGTAIGVAQLIEAHQVEVRRKEQAEAQKEQALAASRAKSMFLANMSHELRTPLNAIIGYSEMLQEEVEDRGYVDLMPDLQRIHQAGKLLLAEIDTILDLSKIEAGKMELFLETFAITPLIQDVTSTIQPLVAKNANTLQVDCPAEIGSMHADRTKMRQILLNLLSNACKFTNQGTIILAVAREASDGQDWVIFRVSDTGIGISPQALAKLFQPFTQAETATAYQYGGTGLGLVITKDFCELIGGDISVESVVGKGSTFTIRLPAQVQLRTSQTVASSGPRSEEKSLRLVYWDPLEEEDTHDDDPVG